MIPAPTVTPSPSISIFIGVFCTMILLYSYMNMRMKTITKEENEGVYVPNTRKSLSELLVFILVYFSCAYVVLLPESNLTLSVVGTIMAFFISLFIFNKLVFKKLGSFIVIFSSVIMSLFYLSLFAINISI